MKHPRGLAAAAFVGFLICVGADAHSARAFEAPRPEICPLAAPISPPGAPVKGSGLRAKFVGGARLSTLVATPCPRAPRVSGA